MRFEKMDYKQQKKSLYRLHKHINRDFFDNGLKPIEITVENINKGDRPDNFACFSRNAVLVDRKTMTAYEGEKISFSWELVDYMAEQKTQKMQALIAGGIMLHEMVHQYCYENGIDDTNHGGGWEEAAREHNLISIYQDGEQVEDHPTENAETLFYCLYRL